MMVVVLLIFSLLITNSFQKVAQSGERKEFVFVDQKMSWWDANKYCLDNGMQLATVKSKEENSQISKLIKYRAWTSGTHLGEKGKFYWASDFEKVNYSNWARGQPDHFQSIENCIQIYVSSFWNDFPCAEKDAFVCEKFVSACDPPCEMGKCIGPNNCECNEGFTKDSSNSPNVCIPECSPGCITNGACVAPNICKCYSGFMNAEDSLEVCVPICKNGCLNGTCVAPDTCSCDEGFVKENGNCIPKCKEGCGHGKCVAPNECECFEGFSKNTSVSIKCVPECDTDCENGECFAPNFCKCNIGYIHDVASFEVCVPMCKNGCFNGTCMAPDTCSCDEGFVKKNGNCIPNCKEGCGHGNCVAPNECQCFEGYFQNTSFSFKCVPECDTNCENGECFAPNFCKCNIGYINDVASSEVCIPKCENGCFNGKCVAPDSCSCDEGFDRENGFCIPDCGEGCGYGKCVAPNECHCMDGFSKNTSVSIKCVPECDNDCENGECFAPNFCKCFEGYVWSIDTRTCEPNCQKPVNEVWEGVEGLSESGNNVTSSCVLNVNGTCLENSKIFLFLLIVCVLSVVLNLFLSVYLKFKTLPKSSDNLRVNFTKDDKHENVSQEMLSS